MLRDTSHSTPCVEFSSMYRSRRIVDTMSLRVCGVDRQMFSNISLGSHGHVVLGKDFITAGFCRHMYDSATRVPAGY